MFTKLVVEGYRAFDHFEMENLCPVNLIVGMNNRGKTSLLEALELVGSFGDSSVIFASMNRRGELVEVLEEGRSTYYSDLGKIFHGFSWTDTNSIITIGFQRERVVTFNARVTTVRSRKPELFFKKSIEDSKIDDRPFLQLLWQQESLVLNEDKIEQNRTIRKVIKIEGNGDLIFRSRPTIHREETPKVTFLSTEGWQREKLAMYLEKTLFTPDQTFIIECLQILDPNIEGYATNSLNSRYATEYSSISEMIPKNRGVILKLKGIDSQIPIGSLGEGIWRILGVIAGLLNAKGGLFLVDEIDTGLHYSTISKMWQVVTAFAIKHNIQVFATTHSQDCIDSLASVIQSREFPDNSFSIQRINREQSKTVSYTEEEIVSCAEHGIEMR